MGWLKVSELLPLEDEKVVVWLVDELGPRWTICHYQWPEPATGFEGAWVMDYDPDYLSTVGSAELNSQRIKITHWQQMPERPAQ